MLPEQPLVFHLGLLHKPPVSIPFSVLTQSVRLPLASHYFVQRTSVTYGMRYYPTVHQMLLDHLSREAEDIPKGDKYSNHIPLLIYLHYLPPKEY